MHKYDYNFLKDKIPGNIIGLTDIISDLKAKEEIRKLQYEDTFDKLRQKAVIESVKGSNAIEGIVTTDSRIRDIVGGATPLTHDEMEISGYKDALNLIHTEHANLLLKPFDRFFMINSHPKILFNGIILLRRYINRMISTI